ncbi:WXG100 family type VII secretion target [Streptacidiphilus sp. N1-12]|uniref:WXG100 family type VII secretion target n=2 Tax=Streptacidiphilus alkalitolerans TaxID=3342712 RepID=A0ABV6VDG4_9ACTN
MSAAAVASGSGGGNGPAQFKTDFAGGDGGGLVGLRAMIEGAEPETLDGVSSRWTAINQALLAAQADLEAHTTAALGHWEGDAADGFATRAKQLSQALSNGASYASNASSGVSTAAAALRQAKQQMPSMPSGWDRFTRKLTSETNDHAFKQDLDSGMSRTDAIKQDGGELSLLEERHQQAVAVIETLEASYNTAAQMIGTEPMADIGGQTVWPPPPTTTKGRPVTRRDSAGVGGPKAEGGIRAIDDKGTSTAGLAQSPDPSGPSSVTAVGDSSNGDGVLGGEHIPASPSSGTTIQDVTAGIDDTGTNGPVDDVSSGGLVHEAGSGAHGGLFGDSSSKGVSGGASIDTVAGHQGIEPDKMSWFGSPSRSGGVPAGTSVIGHREVTESGGAIEEEFARTGADVQGRLGESDGPAQGSAMGVNESSGLGTGQGVNEESADLRNGGAAGGGAGQGNIGMMGGVGNAEKQGRKRRRRPRPHYLVEDDELWGSGIHANPPVIT